MSKEKLYNSKVEEPCDDCKESVWRVFVDSTNIGTMSEMYQNAIRSALVTEADFSSAQANSAAQSVLLMPTPTSLIYSGDKDIAFKVLDELLLKGIDAGISQSKEEVFK